MLPEQHAAQVVEELPGRRVHPSLVAVFFLPKHFVNVHYYGGFANTNRAGYLKLCCRLLDVASPSQAEIFEQDGKRSIVGDRIDRNDQSGNRVPQKTNSNVFL
jgi:hypothetical protein